MVRPDPGNPARSSACTYRRPVTEPSCVLSAFRCSWIGAIRPGSAMLWNPSGRPGSRPAVLWVSAGTRLSRRHRRHLPDAVSQDRHTGVDRGRRSGVGIRSDRPRPVTRRDRRLPRPGDDRRLVEGGRVRTGQGLRSDRGGNSARRCDDSSNAVGNFCFEVSLSYRRVELPRRVSAAV